MPQIFSHPAKNSSNRSPIIRVENVSYSYTQSHLALKDVSFDVMEGDFIGLVGPNGGGKSTLLKIMMGILPLQHGSVKLFGVDLKHFRHWFWIGYVSQKATHFDKRFPATVREIVAMGLTVKRGLFRTFQKEDETMIQQALDEVQMLEYEKTPLHELSGGQQQRIFIARALASHPKLLVLDEPTIGIDLQAQEQFYLLLQKLRQKRNLTILLVSHDIDVMANQANVFACLNQTLVYHGKPRDFFKDNHLEKLYGKNLRMILHDH